MGLTHVAVEVRNRDSNETFSANFLVDTGSTDSMVPANELKRIGIEPIGKKTYEVATGELKQFDVAYADVSFLDETLTSRVIFGPDNAEPILGVIALESMGVIVDPVNQTLKKLPGIPLKYWPD
ncbi:MAG TPA: clan AA aspartic protease [Pyrinomonadaceae bacterium]|nr:clan AA aspartic protease [Pyrinomonadaceae bacterium]